MQTDLVQDALVYMLLAINSVLLYLVFVAPVIE